MQQVAVPSVLRSELNLRRDLKDKFGFSDFIPGQRDIIEATLLNKDCFVVMPHSKSRSLCYQLPALVYSKVNDSITIVLAPLLTLIKEEVAYLNTINTPSEVLCGKMAEAERRDVVLRSTERNIPRSKRPKMLYMTPEYLSSSTVVRQLLEDLYKQGRLARFVIDEAHCISDWAAHRPSYLKLSELRRDFSTIPFSLMTASASDACRSRVLDILAIDPEHVTLFTVIDDTYSSSIPVDIPEKLDKTPPATEDVTELASQALHLIAASHKVNNLTKIQVRDCLIGFRIKKKKVEDLPGYGSAAGMAPETADKIITLLETKDVIGTEKRVPVGMAAAKGARPYYIVKINDSELARQVHDKKIKFELPACDVKIRESWVREREAGTGIWSARKWTGEEEMAYKTQKMASTHEMDGLTEGPDHPSKRPKL